MLTSEGPAMRFPLFLTAAPLVLLAACQTAPGPATGEIGAASSSYGMFLAGQSALNNGKNGEASKFFDQARSGASGDAMLSVKDFTSAVLAGDVQKAALLAPTGDDASEPAKRLGKLVVAVEALAEGKGK